MVMGSMYMNAKIGKSSIAEAGNGLFASKYIEEGQAIFTLARPLVTALDNKKLSTVCSNCFSWTDQFNRDLGNDTMPVLDVKACQGCQTLRYCSKRCQSESWKRNHKAECRLLGKLSSKGSLPNAARAVLQMMHLHETQDPFPLKDLVSHRNLIMERGGERAEQLLILSTGIHEYSGTKQSIEFIQNCFALVFTNSLTLWSPTFDALGICLDPFFAAANHSCNPNAVAVFDGPKLSFCALRDIKKGEEVCISYIDASNPLQKRQQELQERFYFSCACSECKLGLNSRTTKFDIEPRKLTTKWVKTTSVKLGKLGLADWGTNEKTVYNGTDPASILLTAIEHFGFKKLEEASHIKEPKEAITVLQTGIKACALEGVYPRCRQPLPALMQELFVYYLKAEQWIQAFLCGMRIQYSINSIIYERYHPVPVVHMWTLASLMNFMGNPPLVKPFEELGFDWDRYILTSVLLAQALSYQSHGAESSFCKLLDRRSTELRNASSEQSDITAMLEDRERLNDVASMIAEDSWYLKENEVKIIQVDEH